MFIVWKKLFVCLILWSLSSHSRIFHSYVDITIAGEGLQILTYARLSWSLSSEGSLTCHTYCDTGLPFIMVISEDPWHSHRIAGRLAVLTTQVCRDLGSNPDLPHARQTSTPTRRQRKKLNNRIWYWSCTRKVMPINVIKKKQVTTDNCLQYGTIIINF